MLLENEIEVESHRDAASCRAGEGSAGRTLCMFATGLLVGAGLMFVLDPSRGRRRRALIRDKTVSLSHRTRRAVKGTAIHARNRARGVAANARRMVLGRGEHEATEQDDPSCSLPRQAEAS
jgi:hypothetical protein